MPLIRKTLFCDGCDKAFAVVGTGEGERVAKTVFCLACGYAMTVWWPRDGFYYVDTARSSSS